MNTIGIIIIVFIIAATAMINPARITQVILKQ